MKKYFSYILIIVLSIISLTLGYLYLKQTTDIFNEEVVTNLNTVDGSDYLYSNQYFDSLPEEELSEAEKDGLLLMREEEKLAHDVYTKLYEKWGISIFKNISDSEQTHTDMVKDLLVKYDITDPVTNTSVGVFENQDLLDLYTQLVDNGSQSINDALTVGALVEDLDIKDLEDLMMVSDNEDILAVYQNLQKGSRNHLRSFVRTLNRNGEEYTPSYISLDAYNEILGTPSENGVTYDSEGNAI
jgi:hypothetical protein